MITGTVTSGTNEAGVFLKGGGDLRTRDFTLVFIFDPTTGA
jgi:hypothetical protein